MSAEQPTLWPRQQVLAVALAAVLLRLALFLQARDSAFLHTPVVDASFFDIWARALADGRTFQDQAFFKPPLYPYVLAFFYKLGLGMSAVIWLQMLSGIVTSLLTLAVGRLVFAPRAALVGAIVCALLPILAFFEIQLLAESWTTALTMGGLLMLLLAIRGIKKSPGRWFLGAGLLLGLAALGRPNLLLVVAVFTAWIWFKAKAGLWDRQGALLLLAGFLLAISPATLHNLRHGEASLISANLGANLIAGNSDSADGLSAIPVGVLWDDLQLRTRQADQKSPGAASRFLTGEATAWMKDNPRRALELLGRKILLFLGGEEPANNINVRWFGEKENVLVLKRWWPATWLLLPFAAVGLAFWRGSRRGEGALLRWYVLAQFLGVLPFFVNARFRAPLLPVLALLAAAGAFWLWENRRQIPRLAPAAALLVASLVVANVDWLGLRSESWLARDYFNHGLIYARGYDDRTAQPDLAEENFRQAVQLDPQAVDYQEHLGAWILDKVPDLLAQAAQFQSQGDLNSTQRVFRQAEQYLSEAAQHHLQATKLFPRSFRSWTNLGSARMWHGDIRSFSANLAHNSGQADEARQLAVLALQDYHSALSALTQSRQINPQQAGVADMAQAILAAVSRLPDLDPSISAAQQQIQSGRVNR